MEKIDNMKIIYMQRTIQSIMNSGIELPEGHLLRNGNKQPEVKELKEQKYFVFEILDKNNSVK